jgi:GDP-D-mannose 3',5'-epimerase
MGSGGRVVVAGGGGFIGGHLVARLLRLGYDDVVAVDVRPLNDWYQLHPAATNMRRDLRDRDACLEVTRGASFVFNLAADMGGMGYIETHRAACMLSVLINTHLLMAAADNDVRRFFYASSACVYNVDLQRDSEVLPLREEDAYPAKPEDGYGWEKLFSERMCRHFTDDFGLLTRVARFHNVYGPHGTWEGGREKAPAAICRKVAEAVITGNHVIDIWGDGEQTRSFMYVDDCVEGVMRLFESSVVDPINIGSSEIVSVNQLVSIVEGIAGVRLDRRYIPDAPLGVRGRNSDNTRILRELGWQPGISLQSGLERTYEWVSAQVAERAERREGPRAIAVRSVA